MILNYIDRELLMFQKNEFEQTSNPTQSKQLKKVKIHMF